ncbi:uncharacterized protein LOC114279671 [Camellia sinensis]|uniref:uncharacterized protein LOC114279671 n=1 Tax=Camellia sinensis TaxID=4442 RepID=UPI001036C5D8|nr:uncharacterized protein LOC114279671 [Camellia sinensis]
MAQIDKGWMTIKNRLSSREYQKGVNSFIEFVKINVGFEDKIRCPCIDCFNDKIHTSHVVKIHLIRRGISLSYKTWVHHGELVPVAQPLIPNEGHHVIYSEIVVEDRDIGDDLPTMLEKVCRGFAMDEEGDELPASFENVEGRNFDKLFEDAQRKLYLDCTSFTMLSFVIKMLHIKVYNKWSNNSFDMVMKVFKATLPEWDETVPWTIYAAKKFLRDLGLGYVPIYACRYDCALFWKENANLHNCPKCKEPRYKLDNEKDKKIPHKILRYFLLTSRLKRLCMSKKNATDMRWQKEKRLDDGILRHPADAEAWKEFDWQHPVFAMDPRNVRPGLATNGFNPFGNMSTSYSMWHAILMPYNLPPWKYMKEPFSMMSLLIPGRLAPGRDIDIYLQPLVDELKELWGDGVQTYDAKNEQLFTMHAAMMWTINDFPAYGNMSGWTTKGYLACPMCSKDASSQRLTREQLLEQIETGTYKPFGKHPNNRKRQRDENPVFNWTKRSIMFELPYWKTLKLRHNLDVMHIEKNICDNLMGTLLNVDGKNKDTEKARIDLANLKIRKELHLQRRGDGSFVKPPVVYTLSTNERQGFYAFLKSIKYPDGYAANISNCVNADSGKISGLKSHDCHVLVQRLLPVGMRGYLNNAIGTTLFELGNFFQQLCSKTLKVTDLEKLQDQSALVLCKLEKIFPPAFFDVMVHLVVQLPREAILGGPVQYRWMYPIERLLGTLKGFVANKAHLEGSIAEAYFSKECITFCSMYLDGIETMFNQEERNDDGGDHGSGLAIFSQNVRPFGLISRAPDVSVNEREIAHWFVLYNSFEVEQEHKNILQNGSTCDTTKRQRDEFPKWFKECINQLRNQGSPEATDELWSLANGPSAIVNTHSGCVSNGVRFHTIDRDNRSQVEQVFYVNDTNLGGNWKVVERFHHRGIWNVPEMDGVPDDVLNSVFQQDETTEVVTIVDDNGMQFEGGGDEGVLCRDDIECEIIPNTMVTKIEFMFDLDADTTLLIAGETVEQLDLPNEDVTLIAELIDNLIVKTPATSSIAHLILNSILHPHTSLMDMHVGVVEA